MPLAAPVQISAGVRAPHYSDDLLYRIHVTPSGFQLGNVAGTITRTIAVWNALFRDVTLLSVGAIGTDGMTLTGHAAPPLTFGALQDRDYTVTISPAGPPAINASYTWTFSEGSVRLVTFIGNRAIAWTWAPNWEQGITERLEWRTEVLRSHNAREQRRRLRRGARRIMELSLLLQGAERQQFEMALFGWGARSWALPIWWDGQAISAPLSIGSTSIAASTTDREFSAGSLALITTGSTRSEIVEVQSLTGSLITLARPTVETWPAGSMLYPAIIAQLDAGVSVERFTGDASIPRVRFTALQSADVAAGALPMYLGYPVLDSPPLLRASLAATYERKLSEFDNGTGFPFREDEAGIPITSQTHGWLAATRAQKGAVRSLLYLLAGRFGAVWMPTMASDVTIVADAANAASNIDIANIRYGVYGVQAPGRGHLRIQRRNATVSYHKITGSSEISSAVERLSLTPSITPALLSADALQVSFMQLNRQRSDAVEIAHFTGESFSVQTAFEGFRHDL